MQGHKEQQTEIAILIELSCLPIARFNIFVDNTSRELVECFEFVANIDTDSQSINYLFRAMHTLKGNARTNGLLRLSGEIHKFEQIIDDYVKGKAQKSKTDLKDGLMIIEELAAKYVDVGRNKLRMYSSESATLAVNSVDRVQPLDAILHQYLISIPLMAKELGKPAPQLIIESRDLKFDPEQMAFLLDVIGHLIRNSLVHGLESAKIRRELNKPIHGRIHIKVRKCGSSVKFTFSDDGQGLDLAALGQIGVEKGKWSDPGHIDAIDVAALIFEPGISTNMTGN